MPRAFAACFTVNATPVKFIITVDVCGKSCSIARVLTQDNNDYYGVVMIVIEGIDNSGKSTLAEAVAQVLGYDIRESEGPPKSKHEINYRAFCYSMKDKTIFVRHPVISERVYCVVRDGINLIEPETAKKFYDAKPTLVYCDPLERKLKHHVKKKHDTPEHLAAVEQRYNLLLQLYRTWAIQEAQLIYRIGDDVSRMVDLICTAEHL